MDAVDIIVYVAEGMFIITFIGSCLVIAITNVCMRDDVEEVSV
jgi:hypothetical protein